MDSVIAERTKERDTISPSDIPDLLQLIKDAESYGDGLFTSLLGTDSYNVRNGSRSDAGLTDMTLREVYDLLKKDGRASGAYQISKDTMEWLVKYSKMDVDWDDKFDPEMQDRMAVRLAERRGLKEYLNGDISSKEFSAKLAKEWAGLPKDEGGLTHYTKEVMESMGMEGANAATVEYKQVVDALPKTYAVQDAERQEQMDSLGVNMPTAEKVTVPQPRQPAPAAPPAPESQPSLEAMLAAQQDQAMNPVVRPSEPAPIPQPVPVEPERVAENIDLSPSTERRANPNSRLQMVNDMEAKASERGLLNEELAGIFSKMRRLSVSTGSGWDNTAGGTELLLADPAMRGQVEWTKDQERQNEKLSGKLETINNLKELAVERGKEEELAPVIAKMERLARDDTEVLSEVVGLKNAAYESLTMGFRGDEDRAYYRYMDEKPAWFVPTNYKEDSRYKELLAEEREKEKEFAGDNPVLDFTARFGGGIATGGAVGRAFGVGKTGLQGMTRQGAGAGMEGFLYGYNEGEGSFANRLESGAYLGAATTLLGGGFGYVGGRMVENTAKRIKQDKALEEARVERVKELNLPTSSNDDVIDTAQRYLTELAEDGMRQTGKELTGLDYGNALKRMSEVTGLKIKRLLHAEMATGRQVIDFRNVTIDELTRRNSRLAKETGFNGETYDPNIFAKYYNKIVRPLSKYGEKWVSKAYGMGLQRVATQIARKNASIEKELMPNREFTPAMVQFQEQIDDEMKRLILNMSNIYKNNPGKNFEERRQAFEELRRYVWENKQNPAQVMQGFEQARRVIAREASEYRRAVDSDLPNDPFYWPSIYKTENKLAGELGPSNTTKLDQQYTQRRNQLMEGDMELSLYEDPLTAAMSQIRKWNGHVVSYDTFKLRNIAIDRRRIEQEVAAGVKGAKKKLKNLDRQAELGQRTMKEMEKQVKAEGGDSVSRQMAGDTLNTLLVYGARGPTTWIANMRKAAYMGTIGNPYSAVLNLGDMANAVVNFGFENTAAAVVDVLKRRGVYMTVDDIGLANQATGEFLQDGTGAFTRNFAKASDSVFTATGFRAVDSFGKEVSMNAAIRQGQQAIRNGTFKDEWGFAFSTTEMRELEKDLIAGNKTKLTKDFAAANLAKLQPSDMAQMPKWYLENPNWRVLWMLKTFAMKQLQQIENLVIDQWKRGEKKQSVKNAIAYMGIVGGTNAFLMEGRQVVKGDTPDLSFTRFAERYMDWAIGVGTVNLVSSYSLEKARQSGGSPFSVTPFGEMLYAPMADAISIGKGEFDGMEDFMENSETLGWGPMGRLVQDWADDD